MIVPLAPVDLRATLALQTMGKYDPTGGWTADGAFVKTFADGPAGAHVRVVLRAAPGGLAIDVAGNDALAARWLAHLPGDDGYAAFAPAHPLVAELHRTHPGMRMLRVPWGFDLAVGAILQQRVRVVDAIRSWREIVRRYGTTSALGVAGPSAHQLARLTGAHLEACNVDAKRARAIMLVAREHALRDLVGVDGELAALRARLPSLAGIGPWTTALILGLAYGDPDALLVGDLDLPRRVCWTLARDPHGTDAKMVELLAPFAGQRQRVARLLVRAGQEPPRVWKPR